MAKVYLEGESGYMADVDPDGRLKVALTGEQAIPDRGQVVMPETQETTDSFEDIEGSQIDTKTGGEKRIAYHLGEVGETNGVTFKVVGSIDGDTWYELTAVDATGTSHGSSAIAVSAGASTVAIIDGAISAFRFFKVQAKSTVEESPGEAVVMGFAK